MMDVDHFKRINDDLGHLNGDRVLQEIGTILRDLLRGYDFAARYGGDEFTIVLPQRMEEKAALEVAERIRRTIADHVFGLRKGKKEDPIYREHRPGDLPFSRYRYRRDPHCGRRRCPLWRQAFREELRPHSSTK